MPQAYALDNIIWYNKCILTIHYKIRKQTNDRVAKYREKKREEKRAAEEKKNSDNNNEEEEVHNENEDNNRLEYGKEVLKGLSDELTKYLGKGYSVSNLKYMRMFYKTYPNFEEISMELTWTHYNELIIIKDEVKRKFYEKRVWLIESYSLFFNLS